jgi:hypothetical protein
MDLFKSNFDKNFYTSFENGYFQNKILTNLGEVIVSCELNQSSYKFESIKQEYFDSYIIRNDNITVEIITSDINSKDNLDLGVDYIRFWLIRFISKQVNQSINMNIDFNNTFNLPLESGGGQGYVYKLYNQNNYSLAIGTEDLDFLEDRKNEKKFLSEDLFEKIYNTQIEDREKDNSFQINLHDLDCNVINQIQFVMSISSSIEDKDNNYTSDSICQYYEYLLKKLILE